MVLVLLVLASLQSPSLEGSPPLSPESRARILAAAPALADVPEARLATYSVEGRTPQSIRASINRSRPAEVDGGDRFDSVTRWVYRTRWRNSGPDQCRADTAEVELTVKITLPDLIAREALSTREKASWDQYFQRLVGHELNHARIAEVGAERMQAALREARSCADMAAARERIGAEVRDASREYDRLTEHGRREGAVYPPGGRR
jgi:predicted secreted Zn-dependent protease